VIREKDILACQDGKVTYRYQDSKTKRYKTKTVSGGIFYGRYCSMCCLKAFVVRGTLAFCTPIARV